MTQPEASPSNNADAGRGLSEGLGPLPEPDMLRGADEDYYSAEAMKAERQRCYALGMAAERERCAKLCEEVESQAWALWKTTADPIEQGRNIGAQHCADAIRA